MDTLHHNTEKQPPLLEFENITVMKGGQKVLDSVSVTIREGENIAILGPNGAGKSSFIKTLTREYYPYAPDDGTVFRIWGHQRCDVLISGPCLVSSQTISSTLSTVPCQAGGDSFRIFQ